MVGVTLGDPGSETVSEIMTREQWRLKISRDSIVRDLIVMHEILEYSKKRTTPSPRKSISYIILGAML